VVVPSVRRGTRRAYTFQDLIALRAALGLLKRGVKLRDVVKAVDALRTNLPRVRKPLLELKVVSDGAKVVVKSSQGAFEPTTGQMVLDFDVRALREDVVRVLRPAVKQHRARVAFELYKKASELDEDPRTMDDAAKLYKQAIETDPLLAIAYTNLGNILFRKGDEAAAEALYSKALAIDPKQPEAKYNLGYLMLERHELDVAIKYFQGAIEADPRFADAYFNLAMAFEELGDKKSARPLWRTYLELEPSGTWADIARQHLG
jgi:tetratricopeptide (TPR) repeat protein